MPTPSPLAVTTLPAVLLVLAFTPAVRAQSASGLPPTAPTSIAPIAAIATPADQAGGRHHRAQVSCTNGQLTIHADNSSLNGILRSVSRCTGMIITGGVLDQRVFGDYGPAAPGTVLATLLDGTGVNMLLQETAADQPALLILTPRTGGPTLPDPSHVPDTDLEVAAAQPQPGTPAGAQPGSAGPGSAGAGSANRSAYANQPLQGNNQPAPGNNAGQRLQPYQGIGNRPGSAVTSPPSIPLPTNNVNGNPGNTSPTASTYPTTNSVPLDSLPTPSTTPSSNGIVDAPNPPAPGSDTAALLNGSTTNVPATTNVVDKNTSNATLPGGTNTVLPAPSGSQPADGTAPANGALTPQQVYEQLRRMQQQQAQPANSTQQQPQPQQSQPLPPPASNTTPQ